MGILMIPAGVLIFFVGIIMLLDVLQKGDGYRRMKMEYMKKGTERHFRRQLIFIASVVVMTGFATYVFAPPV